MAIYIGPTTKEMKEGSEHDIKTQDFTGKIFKDHEDLDGLPDERIAAFHRYNGNFYKVYPDGESFLKDWKITDTTGHSQRVKSAFAKQMTSLV